MEEKDTITLTQAEFDARVEEAVANATKDLEKRHNAEMYNARKEIKDLKNANLSQDELREKLRQEQDEATQKELTELRAYRKTTIITERLAKEGLPAYFKNDNRLLTAEDGDLDKAIKDIKKEYEATLPKGNQHSTVVPTNTAQPAVNEKDQINAMFGKALKDLVG